MLLRMAECYFWHVRRWNKSCVNLAACRRRAVDHHLGNNPNAGDCRRTSRPIGDQRFCVRPDGEPGADRGVIGPVRCPDLTRPTPFERTSSAIGTIKAEGGAIQVNTLVEHWLQQVALGLEPPEYGLDRKLLWPQAPLNFGSFQRS